MRLAMVGVGSDGPPRLAIVLDDRSEKVALVPESFGTLDDVVRSGPDGLAALRTCLPHCEIRRADQLTFLRPFNRFNRDVLCTGWNFRRHFEESLGKRDGQGPESIPAHPTFFTKAPDAMIGPYDDISYDAELSTQWDFEAEIAVVIGRDGRSIPVAEAEGYIFGLCVANDVTQRDLQRAYGGQWMKGKSADGSTPIGPWVTTADEFDSFGSFQIECELNGELMQDGNTAAIVFPFAVLISELSRGMTLRAGDIVLTGTPSGIGSARDPQVFMSAGDTLVTRVAGLGELRNRLRSTRLT